MDGPGPVGRDREMSALLTTLDEVRRGAKRVVVLVGEPGVGKSGVINAVADRLRKVGQEVIELAADNLPIGTLDGLRAEIVLTHPLGEILQ